MNTLQEIKRAIESLLTTDRVQLVRWIRDRGYMDDHVGETAPEYGRAVPSERVPVAEYLELEKESRVRHEYVAGDIYAMCAVSRRHNRIAGLLFIALSNHVRRGPCEVYMSDVKVWMRTKVDEYVYYPDLMVACDRKDDDQYLVRNPKLIIEVLAQSTENTDRREKLLHYRFIPALEEYVFIAQKEFEVTIHRRSEGWKPIVLKSPDDVAEFRSIELSLPLAHIYEDALSCSDEESLQHLEQMAALQVDA